MAESLRLEAGTGGNMNSETRLLLLLEKVMSCVVSGLRRFLNWHVLRLAAAAARTSKLSAAGAPPENWRAGFSSPYLETVRRRNEVARPQALARSSSENPPDLSIAQGGAKFYRP